MIGSGLKAKRYEGRKQNKFQKRNRSSISINIQIALSTWTRLQPGRVGSQQLARKDRIQPSLIERPDSRARVYNSRDHIHEYFQDDSESKCDSATLKQRRCSNGIHPSGDIGLDTPSLSGYPNCLPSCKIGPIKNAWVSAWCLILCRFIQCSHVPISGSFYPNLRFKQRPEVFAAGSSTEHDLGP